MIEPIGLREYVPSRVALLPEDRDWLLGSGRKWFRLTRDLEAEWWWLTPGSSVGIVELPSGRQIHCKPKAPVRNVFAMLATAYGFRDPFLDSPIEFEQIDQLFDFLVEHLANLVEARLARGLFRAYVEREENLPAVRGRIMIAEDVRRNAILRHRTHCQFTEFTWDIPENRVIRQTLFAVAGLVRSTQLQRRLATLDRVLGEIDPTPMPLSTFDTFHYHRLNDDYRPIHRLCRLLLEGSSLSEHMGNLGFRAFLLDMNQLYEQFLQVALAEALPQEFVLAAQHVTHLDEAQLIRIRPDMTVTRHAQPILIADAKYKLHEGEAAGHADLYQIIAYCTAAGIERGMLIYPKWEGGGESVVDVRRSGITIARVAIDLAGSVSEMHEEISRIAERMLFAGIAFERAAPAIQAVL